MNYFDSENTNEIVSLDDVNAQKQLDKLAYENYLKNEYSTISNKKRRKRKRRYWKKKRGAANGK